MDTHGEVVTPPPRDNADAPTPRRTFPTSSIRTSLQRISPTEVSEPITANRPTAEPNLGQGAWAGMDRCESRQRHDHSATCTQARGRARISMIVPPRRPRRTMRRSSRNSQPRDLELVAVVPAHEGCVSRARFRAVRAPASGEHQAQVGRASGPAEGRGARHRTRSADRGT